MKLKYKVKSAKKIGPSGSDAGGFSHFHAAQNASLSSEILWWHSIDGSLGSTMQSISRVLRTV